MKAFFTLRLGLAVLSLLLSFCNRNNDTAIENQPNWKAVSALEQSVWWMNAFGTSERLLVAGGTPEQGKLMERVGDSWEEIVLEEPVPLLNWGHAFEDGEIFIVGNVGTIMMNNDGNWQRMEVPTDQDLWGVWGASAEDIWAVGGSGRVGGEAVLLHWDGMNWSSMEYPALTRANVFAFFKVWGFSHDDVYVVGQNGLVIHFDGNRWEEKLVGTSEDLISLWGAVNPSNGETTLVIVGGRSNGEVVVGRDGEFQSQLLAPLPGLNGVWLNQADEVWVAGILGTLGKLDLETFEVELEETNSIHTLHSVFGNSQGYRISVGGNLQNTDGPFESHALEMNP